MSISLHWLMAVGIISVFILGKVMEDGGSFVLVSVHKSIGITIWLLVWVRLA